MEQLAGTAHTYCVEEDQENMQILNFLSKPRAQAKIQPEFKAPLAKKPHEGFERISAANEQA